MMKKIQILWALLFLFGGIQLANAQFDIPDVPSKNKQTSVYDYAKILNSNQSKSLERKLVVYSDSTSTQMVIITISSLKGEDINMLAAEWGHKWGIGQKGKDNGIVILLSKNDRKIAIQNGYGIEHVLTDALSKRIIERDIIPYFKQNDYYGGLNRGTDAVFEVLTGTYVNENPRRSENSDGGGFPFQIIIIIIIILLSIIKRGGGRGGRKRRGGFDIFDAMILGSSGRGGFGGGSSSSGGFGGGFSGGFGGGGFGGGGASGSW